MRRVDARLNRMSLHCGDRLVRLLPAACGTLLMVGCASPGPPRPPSLRLPEPVRDLSAARAGDGVELSFTVPWQSTDKLPLRGASVRGQICRQLEQQPCVVVATLMPELHGQHTLATWHDSLPRELASGPPRLLSYRVEFFSAAGRSAGRSDAAYTVAGSAPAAVNGLRVEGSRMGVVVSWDTAATADGEVLLQRDDISPRTAATAPAKHADRVAWLKTNATAGTTLDAGAEPDKAYRYAAVRERVAQIGGRSLPYRSAESAPVEFVLRLIYPPLPPTGLTAAGFVSASGGYAVDLVWQPVNDAGMLAGLAGYNVYRGAAKLNEVPVMLPGFHDATANAATRYQYRVTAVDKKGNESSADMYVLESVPQ